MAIGNRIKFIRNLRNLTQKELGLKVGFPERAADVRIAQYESEKRIPKEDLVGNIAASLNVSPYTLTVPDIDTDIGLMHTLFTLEDMCGFRITRIDGELCITLDKYDKNYVSMFKMLNSWLSENEKLQSGEITKEDYDNWRYHYPRIQAERFKKDLDALREKKKQSE